MCFFFIVYRPRNCKASWLAKTTFALAAVLKTVPCIGYARRSAGFRLQSIQNRIANLGFSIFLNGRETIPACQQRRGGCRAEHGSGASL